MYTVYSDGELLYSPMLSKDGYGIISPKVTVETGKAGSMSFVLPPDNVMYNKIDKLKSIITVYQNGEELFRGRVLHDSKDFYSRKNVYVEGDLAFLLDSPVRPYEYRGDIPTLFKRYIDGHNASVEEEKRFEIGRVTVTDSNNYINRSNSNYSNTLDEIKDKIIKTHGGYLRRRLENGIRYIDLIEDFGVINNQIIEFGVNLLDISQYITAEDVFTCLIPVGTTDEDTGERLTIKSVNDGKDYIEDEEAISIFGRIWKTETWDDVTVASNLLRKGIQFLKSGIEMAVSLNVKAVDLNLIDVNTEKIKLGDKIRVISKPHNIDRYFMCTKIVLDLVNPDKNVYTLGNAYKTLTEKQSAMYKDTVSVVGEALSVASDSLNTAQTAVSTASNKQDTLTAGDNIIIAGNVISSEKTEYGLNISNNKLCLEEDGTSDHVPLATEQMINNIPIDANITNVPTVYSKNEQKIGVWIDGKPLYQKTFEFSTPINVSAGTNTNVDMSGFQEYSYISSLVSSFLVREGTTYSPAVVMCAARKSSDTNLLIYAYGGATWLSMDYITLQYTKTTD